VGANERQIGGDHYKTKYEHWDLVIKTGMGYLEGCATKYVSRWRKKGGVADLEKALHYVDKILENPLVTGQTYPLNPENFNFELKTEVEHFCRANDLSLIGWERCVIIDLITEEQELDHKITRLKGVRRSIEFLLAEATPDPKPVPLTEENHHAERATKD
jgi:hypothetical protein